MMNMTNTVALVSALLISSAVSAQTMSADQYRAAQDEIAATYKSEKAACKDMGGNAKDMCIEESKGRERIAKAEMQQKYRPSSSNQYAVGIAKADTAYAIAKEKCDDLAGDAKSVCRAEAKTNYTKAKADVKMTETRADARADSTGKVVDAQARATNEKRDADYALAKTKCDMLADTAKESCIRDAKRRLGLL
jgi:hypothetical protein